MNPRTIIQVGGANTPFHIELKGAVPEAEAIRRAEHIIRASPRLDQPTLGHLLSCLDNGAYTIAYQSTEPPESPSLGDDPYWQSATNQPPTKE